MNINYLKDLLNDKGITPDLISESRLKIGDFELENYTDGYNLYFRRNSFLKVEGDPDLSDLVDVLTFTSKLFFDKKQNSGLCLNRIEKTILELKPQTNIYFKFNLCRRIITEDYDVVFKPELGSEDNWEILDFIIHKLL